MRYSFVVFVLLGVLLPGAHGGRADEESISLVLGQSRVLDFPHLTKVAIGDATIADVKVVSGGRQLLITALSKGATNMTVWRADGRRQDYVIRVLAEDPKLLARDIRDILGAIEGVKVRVVGDRVLLEGEVLTDKDWERVKKVVETFGQVMNFVQKNSLTMSQMVQLDVKMMEVSRDALKDIGLNWQSLLPINAEATLQQTVDLSHNSWGSLTGTFSVLSNFGTVLRILLSDATGRILSNPVLVCKAGEKASFLAGGEIPIPTTAELGKVSIQWKEFGVILRFEPTTDAYNNISMKVVAETSNLDYAGGVTEAGFKIPAVIQRKSETVVNMLQGETLVLAELLTSRNVKRVEKVPLLGNIPIVGELFKSRHFEDGKSEFLVFVTPTMVKPGSLDEKKIQRMKESYKEAGEDIGFSLLD